MGIFYLFIILIIYGTITNLFFGLGKMFNDIWALIDTSIADSGTAVQEFIDYAIAQVDWNQSFDKVLEQVLNTDWLQRTVTGFLQTLDVSVEGSTSGFNGIIGEFVNSIITIIVIDTLLLFVAIWIASAVTGFFIRRKTVKRTILQTVMTWVMQPIITALFAIAFAYLLALIKGYVFLVLIAAFVIYEAISLAFAWFIYKDKATKVKIKDIVTPANICFSFLTSLIIIAIDIAAIIILYFISAFTAILLAVPLLIYSFKIIENNSDSYIKSVVQKT